MNAGQSQGTKSVWLWALLVAFLLSASVGAAVYFVMQRVHSASVDAQVQAAASQPEQQGPPPASVKVSQVRKAEAQQRIQLVGRLMEVRRSVIASEVEGRVVALLTPAGREVVGGETVIARVDPVWSGLAVEQARADLAAAEATARQSARDLALLEDLKKRNATDPQAVDDARAKSEADAANVLARKAALHLAEETNKRVEIVAPFDGTVTKKLTEQGQWLDPGSEVVEIVSRGLIDAVIDVPEQYIGQIAVGTPVQVVIEALGQTIDGEVRAINPDGSNPARTFPVKIRIDDQDGLLKVGMSVTARVPVRDKREYLIVPRDAVQYAENGPQVWMSLVMPGSAPGSMPQGMPMDVDVLFGDGDDFAVRAKPKVQGMDLNPGMDIVVEGAERLWPTRPLMIMPSGGGGGGEGGVGAGGDSAGVGGGGDSVRGGAASLSGGPDDGGVN